MSWLTRIARMIFCIWPERHRQRRALRYMDADQLDDLGITRSTAMRESRKPFWQ
ncbi:DUF1127 domain-containing protein [Sphingomonas sanguinis]|uniref:DUF1127 domain-containing protein n=1 Tax=Sphingomonas sanguinis TaxID=33051 RepID=UPI00301AF5F7